jgi:single-strand DNA-binding protein
MLANHLAKGRRVGIDGRLDWSSWEAQDGGKRSKVEVIANTVQFLDSRGEQTSGENQFVPAGATTETANADFGTANDDDIPF